jgi:hypothetical protein
MRSNNYIATAVVIGIFGVFAILIVLSAVTANNPDVGGVKPAAKPDKVYGFVRLPDAISRFEADGPNGTVTIKPDGKTERLPAGRYNVRYWKTERKDENGNVWVLAGQYYGQNNQFEIKSGNETELDVGEPIVATVDARNVGSNYSFNQVIKGRHDEVIELTCNGSRPQPPKLHIKNKDGSYERTFSFQYG